METISQKTRMISEKEFQHVAEDAHRRSHARERAQREGRPDRDCVQQRQRGAELGDAVHRTAGAESGKSPN